MFDVFHIADDPAGAIVTAAAASAASCETRPALPVVLQDAAEASSLVEADAGDDQGR